METKNNSKVEEYDEKTSKNDITITSKFDIIKYKKDITKFIKNKLKTPNKLDILSDILLDEFISLHLDEIKKSLHLKQIQMKIGNIWQVVIGKYKDFIDLKQGHPSGLDILNEKRKIIIELKNRYNTDNKSSKTSNLNKLSRYKKEHYDYKCIYGIINERSTKPDGYIQKITHDNAELYYYSGYYLLKFIFEEDTDDIITTMKKIISISLD